MRVRVRTRISVWLELGCGLIKVWLGLKLECV